MARPTTERVLRQARLRLVATMMALLTLLVVGVGAATAIVSTSALDADVDRALEAAVQAQLDALGGEEPSHDSDHDKSERPPGGANTVLLVLAPSGSILVNRTGQSLPGLPSREALGAAAAGHDIRTVTTGGVSVRVLTRPVVHKGTNVAYVQGGFDLTLHDQQARSLVLAILLVGALGLVAAAAITLVVTRRALIPVRRAFDSRRQFVAAASHELRTPAALIRANAEVLQREELVAEGGRDLVDDIVGEADRLGGLVGELLQLAAWDEAAMPLEPVSLDAAAVARETVRRATALAAEREVRLAVDAPVAAPAVADRARLVQLLLLLVDNAVDHSPAGGEVTVRLATADGRLQIAVEDSGPGIAPDDRERIFEPFTRLPGTVRHGSGGTGLGLAIARRIAEAHGGTVGAGSSAVGGARFTVLLPVGHPDVGTHSAGTR